MTGPLFRREALEARKGSWLGGISLSRPLGMWVMTGFAAAMSVLVIAVLAFGEYTRRSKVTGQLVPSLGLATVTAPTSGVVAHLSQEEGGLVGRGDALLRISVPRTTVSGGDALSVIRQGLEARDASLRELERSQLEQLDVQAGGNRQQLADMRGELAQIEGEIGVRREQVRIGRETIQRYERVAGEQYVSQVQLNQQRQALLELVNAQKSLERQAMAMRRSIHQHEQALREMPMQRRNLMAGVSRDKALLAQERIQHEADGELLVVSPVPGIVASRLIEAGQAVQAGQPLLTVLPKGSRLHAQLLVPSHAIGFVEPGDRVLIRYDAYPYQKFGHHGGTVLRVSRSAIPATGAQAVEPHYRVLVELDRQTVMAYGRPEHLRPGMALSADVLGDRRKLYEWVLEPLYSLSGS
ncbi:MAG: HlyD family secretion protein [Pseudoxanthomonas sp.]|nr:HlyD family efflux transporter periplasmic adaptor subunit [Pseudoxanthomonas sp.]MCR6686681.1 HlyD family secretion protein [Pseudoxanthomonas sp.]